MIEEDIMVVPRKKLFGEDNKRHFIGFMPVEKMDFVSVIGDGLISMPRSRMEDDPSFKQIIPYSIFVHEGKIFVYKRTTNSGEPRLHEKYSIGIGGHMNPVDGDILTEGMKREFHEEVSYDDGYDHKVIGFVNEEKTSVDKVHFGVVYMIEGETPRIEVAEKDKLIGELESIENIQDKFQMLENWSQLAFENIKSRLMS